MKTEKCIIVGAGDFSGDFFYARKGDLIIAADGGYDYVKDMNIKPDIWLGDMDSTSCELQQAKIKCIQLPKEKDDTDTLAAIRFGLSLGYTHFYMHGMLGGRFDHSIANLQCLEFLRQNKSHGVMYGKDTIVFLLHDQKIIFDEKMKGTISVFAWGNNAKGVTEKGLCYGVENEELSAAFPIGISNEFKGTKSSIEVKDGTLLICIIPDILEIKADIMDMIKFL